MTAYLIDISSHNDIDDWHAVRGNNITGVSVKATQGDYYVNPKATGQVSGARAAGVAAGVYHFGDPDSGVDRDVAFFAQHARRLDALGNGSLLPMLDIEDSPADNIHWNANSANSYISGFIRRWREETGVGLIAVYANLHFYTSLLRPNEWADEQVVLWLALYNGDPGNVGGFYHPRLGIHQHTSKGIVPGARKEIDRNVTVNGFELENLLLGGQAPPDPRPNPGGGGDSGGAGDWPLPPGHYFGDIDGPATSHGGAPPSRGGIPGEGEWVRKIQLRLCELGFARRNNGAAVTDPSGWSDGVYGPATTAAVIRWQQARPDLIETGNIWPDDWSKLFG